jgi:hypothetical protein
MHWILISGLAAAASPVLDGITVHMAEHIGGTVQIEPTNKPVYLGYQAHQGAQFEVSYDQTRADRITVQMRYETSITVNLDGAHWDLTDFVHGSSGWVDLKPGDQGYVLPHITPNDLRRFPTLSQAQIDAAILAYLGDSAAASAPDRATCTDPFSDPCRVGLSRMWLQITAWKDGAPIEGRLVTIDIPMGC